jgi:hypothetical protein
MARSHLDPRRVAAVQRVLADLPDAGRRLISKRTGIPPASVQRVLNAIRPAGATAEPVARTIESRPDALPEQGARTFPVDNSCELVTANPCTLEDLLVACKVDLTVWRVARHVLNKWEVGAKQIDGSVERTPLYQVKAWLERIPGVDDAKIVRETLEWIRQNPSVPALPRVTDRPSLHVDDPHLLEMSVVDLHLGKLSWAPETGANYDSEIAASLHQQAIEGLWAKASVFAVQKILLIVGNDFFNVNGASNATAAGTPQSEDGRWAKTFRRGIAVLVAAIEFLRGKTPQGIEVRVIRGNHDAERVFMLGEVLAAMYAHTSDVRVINDVKKRQYMRWGTVLLGWTHGDGLKLDKLPLLMAGEADTLWAGARHREIHCGHFHTKKETQYHVGEEAGAVRVRVLPSLTAADEWHYNSGFVGSLRAAECYLWSQRTGYVGHFSWTPPPASDEN